jgi:hypothetical protein
MAAGMVRVNQSVTPGSECNPSVREAQLEADAARLRVSLDAAEGSLREARSQLELEEMRRQGAPAGSPYVSPYASPSSSPSKGGGGGDAEGEGEEAAAEAAAKKTGKLRLALAVGLCTSNQVDP